MTILGYNGKETIIPTDKDNVTQVNGKIKTIEEPLRNFPEQLKNDIVDDRVVTGPKLKVDWAGPFRLEI